MAYALDRQTIPSRASAPGSPVGGELYYNNSDGNIYVWDAVASGWVDLTVQGGTPANMVTTDTTQTISGAKTFSTGVTLQGTPVAPTAAAGINTTQIATTAYVMADFVRLQAAQTIAGVKTFSSSPVVDPGSGTSSATLTLTGRNSGTGASATISSSPTGDLTYATPTGAAHAWTIAGTTRFQVTTSGITIPTGATYQINGVQIAAANLSNGTTGSGAVALAAGPTFTGTLTAATAAITTLSGNPNFSGAPTFDPLTGTAAGSINLYGRNAGVQSPVATVFAGTTGNLFLNAATGLSQIFQINGVDRLTLTGTLLTSAGTVAVDAGSGTAVASFRMVGRNSGTANTSLISTAATGELSIASGGSPITFRVAGIDAATMTASTLAIGAAKSGSHPVHGSGYAYFGNSSIADTSGGYAILQDASGGTYFNAASGQGVYVRINNTDTAAFSASGLWYKDPGLAVVRATATQSITTAAAQKVTTMTTVDINNGWYSTANNRYQPGITGWYRITVEFVATTSFSGLGHFLDVNVYRNGAVPAAGQGLGSLGPDRWTAVNGSIGVQGSLTRILKGSPTGNAGGQDYFEVFANTSGSNASIMFAASFELISAQ